MAKQALPCPTVLRLLLRYEPETGKLYWKRRAAWMFPDTGRGGSARAAASWNAKYAGKEAFTASNGHGYKVGNIFASIARAHRVGWAVTYGEWPDEIDHINGVPDDNRLVNLRNVDHAENTRNRLISQNNTTGRVGVTRDVRRGTWVAQIWTGGTNKYLGGFRSLEEAAAARSAAEAKYGYHPNHGRLSQG